jgi:hypothetical protein
VYRKKSKLQTPNFSPRVEPLVKLLALRSFGWAAEDGRQTEKEAEADKETGRQEEAAGKPSTGLACE